MTQENSHLRIIVNQDGAAILDTRQGSIATLNPTGTFIWQGLERGERLETIVAELSRRTGEPLDTVRRDATEFIQALRGQHLLSSDNVEELQ